MVWAVWFHVGTGVGGVVVRWGIIVGGRVVIFAYITRGVTVMEGAGVAKERPVLTGWPVAIGLMTNAITRIKQNAAIIKVISFLSMTAVLLIGMFINKKG
jgi:hypothetical protein